MQTTKTIIDVLRKDCGACLLSEICHAPADVDLYIPSKNAEKAKMLIAKEGYILTSNSLRQTVGRRFEDGQLYILDLISDFNIYTDHMPFLNLSKKGNDRLGHDETLHACFKSVCFNGTHKLPFIEKHFTELSAFFNDKSHFTACTLSCPDSAELLLKSVADKSRFSFFLSKLRNRIKALGTGYSMAFIGPDGSGKSFFVNKMKLVGRTSVVYMGDWFFTLQTLYSFLVTHIPSPWNRFLYIIYFFENLLRQGKVSFLRAMGHIVLIDRFPGTNRNLRNKGLLYRINQLTFFCFPKPDKLVLLHAPPEIIYGRKQELSVKEIEELHGRLHQILEGTAHSVVDTTQLDQSLNELLAAVYSPIPQKVRKSYHVL